MRKYHTLPASGQKQQAIADELGWSREKIRDYAALQKIAREAWSVIGATFQSEALAHLDDVAPSVGATAPFTEGLLRDLIPLTIESRIKAEPFLAKLTDEEWDAARKPQLKDNDGNITEDGRWLAPLFGR